MIRPGVKRLFRLGVRRREMIDRETAEEIEAHIAMRAEQLEREGLLPEAARAEAERRFGASAESRRALLHEAERRERRLGVFGWLDAVRQDLRQAVRSMAGEPGLTAVVVLVIALGVGANAAMFGVLDRLLLRGPEHVVAPEAGDSHLLYGGRAGPGSLQGDDVRLHHVCDHARRHALVRAAWERIRTSGTRRWGAASRRRGSGWPARRGTSSPCWEYGRRWAASTMRRRTARAMHGRWS